MTIESLAKLAVNVRNLRNILSKFGQGAFYAYHDTSQAIPVTSSPTVLLSNTTVVDVNTWLASGTYIPKQPGYYLLFGRCYLTLDADFTDNDAAIGSNNILTTAIRKNGSYSSSNITRRKGVTATSIVIFEANGTTDYFDFIGVHDANAAVTVSNVAFGGVFVSYNNP